MPIPITLTPGSLGPAPCYASEQARYNDYTAKTQASFPGGFSGFLMQTTAPGPDERDQLWVKVDGNNQILGLYTFANGSWTAVSPTFFPTLPGTVVDFFGSIGSILAPWYLCNGAAITGVYNGPLTTPNLQGRMTLGTGTSPVTGTVFTQGQVGGEETHQLTIGEMPAHTHPINTTTLVGSPASRQSGGPGNVTNSLSTESSGGSQAHNTLSPYMALYKIIYWP